MTFHNYYSISELLLHFRQKRCKRNDREVKSIIVGATTLYRYERMISLQHAAQVRTAVPAV